jgi:GT2 family glycosyltransferase
VIGLTIVTYNRPEFCEKAIKSVVRNLGGALDLVVVVNDASDPKHNGAYSRAYRPLANLANTQVIVREENGGVAKAKNDGLRAMLDAGCDWLFVMEDDLRVTEPAAIQGYIDACEASGLHHLMFAHHGPAAEGVEPERDGPVAYFPHAVGAWCVYSRTCLEQSGLFDEHFTNAWEHVEHSTRLALDGFTTGPYRWADYAWSQLVLEEQKGSLDKSSIRPRPYWRINIVHGLRYWQAEKPESFAAMFGDGTPLHDWAMSVIEERV